MLNLRCGFSIHPNDKKNQEWYIRDRYVRWLYDMILDGVNVEDKAVGEAWIKSGQLVSSYESIKDWLGCSYGQAREALKRLENTGEVTHEAKTVYNKKHKNLVITLVHYDEYHNGKYGSDNRLTTDHLAISQQTTQQTNPLEYQRVEDASQQTPQQTKQQGSCTGTTTNKQYKQYNISLEGRYIYNINKSDERYTLEEGCKLVESAMEGEGHVDDYRYAYVNAYLKKDEKDAVDNAVMETACHILDGGHDVHKVFASSLKKYKSRL